MTFEIELELADTERALRDVRALVEQHASDLPPSPGVAVVLADAAALPGPYVPPLGGLWLARVALEPAGCVALKPIPDGCGEIKRMYVRTSFRGRGVARRLLEHALDAARARGFSRVRLGTLPHMTAARSLYESVGFREVPPYRPIELGGDTVFYELRTPAIR